MRIQRIVTTALALTGLLACGAAQAVLKIEITQGIDGALPIAIVPFGWEGSGQPPVDVAAIVDQDLARSGQFSPIDRADLLARPQNAAQIRYPNWKTVGVDHLVIGRMRLMGPDSYVVQFQLFDVLRESQIVGYSFPAKRDQLRKVAHTVSDLIYEKITGVRGAFNTRIAYVSAEKKDGAKRYVLQVADADGYNSKTVLSSEQPLMSPSWSPDGKRVAYVSFEKRLPAIYIQVVKSAQREKISALQGINGAPVWSPDGKRLALTLSHQGNPDVYVLDIRTRNLSRVTRSTGIDTEPAWSPDGQGLYFTSNRSGNPQIYYKPVSGGRAKRLTFEGKYNASATVAPDGERIAMVHSGGGPFRIAVLNRKTGALRVLTEGQLDESPSFAPNGSMILYATQSGGRGVLGAVSVDGRMKQRLSLTEGDVREPVWSPYAN